MASAAVLGWAAWFGVVVLESGPQWAIRHLRFLLPLLSVVFIASLVGLVWVRPIWVPIGVGYPAVIGLVIGLGRSRQMIRIQQTDGFSEIDPAMKSRLLDRYGRGLVVTAVVAGLAGAVIMGAGYWQGGILVALGLFMLLVRQRAKASA